MPAEHTDVPHMSHPALMTADDLLHVRIPEKRFELVKGVLVVREPAGGRHGRVTSELTRHLANHVDAHRLGAVYAAETGFTLAHQPDTVRAPDIAFVRRERLPDPEPTGFPALAPALVVEVLSPGDRPGEVLAKVADWLSAATRADLVRARDQPWHVYHRPTWHYADFYWDVENGRPHDIPGAGPDSLNAAERIVALRATLTDANAADTTKAVALAWLLHLVGDIHQPLHCSSRVTPDEALPQGDKGGNTFRLDDDRNLHAYWDHILAASVAPKPGEDSIAYAGRMAHRIEETHPLAAPLAATDVLGWCQEGLRLAQTVAYAGVTRGSVPSPAYEAEALKVAELRVALAGYRLAALLNAVLTP